MKVVHFIHRLDGRSLFCWLLLLSTFSSLKCSAAVEQQSLSSTPDSALPDTPQPPQIPGSAGTDSQQTAAGTISGTVLDPNRNVLQGARVTVAGQSSSAFRTLESGSNGEFAFTGLCPDTYELTVAAPGMNTFTSSDISLRRRDPPCLGDAVSLRRDNQRNCEWKQGRNG